MKKFLLLATLLVVTGVVNAQQIKTAKQVTPTKTKQRPEDDIRKYFFVMLTIGDSQEPDSVTAAKLQAGHMANITKLYYDGKIKVAGPFGDNGKWRGLFIFDCATKEEVETLLQLDPAIAAGSLSYEVHPWYTAAIGSFVPGKPVKR